MSEMTASHQNPTKHCQFVLVVGFDDVLLMDVAGPTQVFASTNKVLGWSAYQVSIASENGGDVVTDTGLILRVDAKFATVDHADILLVPGGPGVARQIDNAVLRRTLVRVETRVDRFVSICSGSLITAAAGLLDGRKATTHWERTKIAHQQFPQVEWHLDEIFTRDGKFHCSAGVTTGIDLALSLVEADHGRHVALGVAREMVVFMQRQGGQSQYSQPLKAQATLSKRLGNLYNMIEQDPTAQWSVSSMAAIAGVTERTLHRDFTSELAQTPLRFVEERRLGVARTYLERSGKSVKEIASLSGFVTEQKMRRCFVKRLGILPTEYRDRFGEAGIHRKALHPVPAVPASHAPP